MSNKYWKFNFLCTLFNKKPHVFMNIYYDPYLKGKEVVCSMFG